MPFEELEADQLVELASLLVALMIFFSIDAKYRFRRSSSPARWLFRWASIGGGIATVLAVGVVWVELFLPDDDKSIHMLAYFLPASLAIVAAFILAIEVIFLRKSDDDSEERE